MTAAARPLPRGDLLQAVVRRTPIRWRIFAIAVLNSAVAVVLLGLIWNGSRILDDAWRDVNRVGRSERFLSNLDSDAERLQSLIHRYFAQPDGDVLAKILDLRDNLISRLRVQARLDPLIAGPTRPLTEITERFILGFDELRELREGISLVYEAKVLAPAREMATVLTSISGSGQRPGTLAWPSAADARDSYNSMLLAATAFYLSTSDAAGRQARDRAAAIRRLVRDVPAPDGADALGRALAGLAERAGTVAAGVEELGQKFAAQARLLRDAIDRNTEAMAAASNTMKADIRDLEQSAQQRFDRTLHDVALRVALLAIAFVALVALLGLVIARSISEPLGELSTAMQAITSGRDETPVEGIAARDEIGEMARAVEVFRENAVAKRRAEADLRTSKERAETAFRELRDTQTSLIEAEKLAALGGLVAGVAHEVNNPVGISLTVASSLAQRCDDFAREVASGTIRRSRLQDFTDGTRLAANQLVANLVRAGDLVQSFKQVAVDRSQAERRPFDLGGAVEQILASLRPTLRTSGVTITVDIPPGIEMDSYPGPLGQILTNLFLNSLLHGFEGREGGSIAITGQLRGPDAVELVFRDDGHGMSDDVQRSAFEPFFTTRRGSGGTGLGLHIVYNLVTSPLGGRICLSSAKDHGTTFRMVLPRVAPSLGAAAMPNEADHARA